ncbi:hypothetical protein VCHC67A1_00652A, partial [Vibrio cholerae HC-67A1]
MPLPLLGGGW